MSKGGLLVKLGLSGQNKWHKEKIFRHPVFRFHSQVDLESVNFTCVSQNLTNLEKNEEYYF